MSGVLARAAELFLVTEAPEPDEAVAPPPAAVRAVVLGSPRDVSPLAAALALSLRATGRAATAVVAAWQPGGVEDARASAATRSAARLAGRLNAAGFAAAPRGRLASVALPPDPAEAADAVRRASQLVDGPLVTALGGPRPDELERLVAEHDLAVVAAEPDTALARAALAALEARGISASVCRPLPRGIPRALAVAGLAAARLDLRGFATPRLGSGGVAAPHLDPGDFAAPHLDPGDFAAPDLDPGDFVAPHLDPGDFAAPHLDRGDLAAPRALRDDS